MDNAKSRFLAVLGWAWTGILCLIIGVEVSAELGKSLLGADIRASNLWPLIPLRIMTYLVIAIGGVVAFLPRFRVTPLRIRLGLLAMLVGLSGGLAFVRPSENVQSAITESILSVAILLMGLALVISGLFRRWHCKWYYPFGSLALVMTVLFVWTLHDDPPVTNDYQPSDILYTGPGAKESCELLLTFYHGGQELVVNAPHTMEKTIGVVSNIMDYAEEVERAWQDIAAGRQVIEKLVGFERITDVIDPAILTTEQRFSAPSLSFKSYRTIGLTYFSYAHLQTKQGKSKEGARELARVYQVCRKGMRDGVCLITKMIWVGLANASIERAYLIAIQPECSAEALRLLKEEFRPLTKEETSLRRSAIGEYLFVTRALPATIRPKGTKQILSLTGKEDTRRYAMGLYLSNALGFRPNTTTRAARTFLDLALEGIDNDPPDIEPAYVYFEDYMERPRVRNWLGWRFITIATPYMSKSANAAFEGRIKSELLAVYLSKRLGEQQVFNDPFTGKPYETDTQGVPFSVGYDRKAGTPDDLRLGSVGLSR